jgi:hypothetical protein
MPLPSRPALVDGVTKVRTNNPARDVLHESLLFVSILTKLTQVSGRDE